MVHPKKKIMLWYWGRRGGGCRYALELARALQARGDIELHMSLSAHNNMLDDFFELGAPVHIVRTYTSWFSFLMSTLKIWFVRRGLMKYLEQHGIACVLSPMPHLWSPFIIPAIKKRGYFFISTIHDPEPHLGDRISYPKMMIKNEIRAADHVICLSEFVATRLRNLYNYARHDVTICPNGIFSFGEDFSPGTWPEDGRPFRFLFFGRILPYKGLPMLLKAFAQLVHEGANVELTIAGNGDVSSFVALMETPGVRAEIRWIAENEIPVFYGEADAVVLPYIDASQSGIWADAAAFHKPCVVTPVAGLVEQVEDGVIGLVTQKISPESLADAMRRVMEPKLYQHLVKNLRALDHREEWNLTAEKIAKLL